MSEKRYYWLKLPVDFFRKKEVKRLRQISDGGGGNALVIIYLKMLLQSLQNDGKLFYDSLTDNFVSELALDLDEKVDDVCLAVDFLFNAGILAKISDSEYEVLTAREMTGSETASAARKRRNRARQNHALAGNCHTRVTNCPIEIEIEKEEDADKPLYSSESQSASEPPVITLPLNDKSEFPVFQEQCNEWAGLYPAVDVAQQLRNMKGWLNANPSRRKTRSGILRFITGWLAKEQNQGGGRDHEAIINNSERNLPKVPNALEGCFD